MKKVIIRSCSDDRTCEDCKALDGKIVSITEAGILIPRFIIQQKKNQAPGGVTLKMPKKKLTTNLTRKQKEYRAIKAQEMIAFLTSMLLVKMVPDEVMKQVRQEIEHLDSKGVTEVRNFEDIKKALELKA